MRLQIIGAGVNPKNHLTLEGVRALRSSRKILSLLTKEDDLFIQSLGVEPVSITFLYKSDARDTDNYSSILKYVRQALNENLHVSLLVPGHPQLGVTISQLAQRFFEKKKGIKISFLPGISSFATMHNELNLDPLEAGSVLVDVNRMLLYRHTIDPKLNYFFYHICSIANPITNYLNPQLNNSVNLLKEYLEKFYSTSRTVYMIESATIKKSNRVIKESTVGDLTHLIQQVNFNCTLFIPANNKFITVDQKFLARLKNKI